ncbi:hypothetical protein [Parasitella parasitica]|uniref:Transcription regulator Rua1 C-terminal domain-containing protein n=1 Tax=Parasitella parasitica TaxID=35722 RepID=A0A0B7N8I3_9FUNG|nr:hypothetical protein [Parasitella parasitica]
MFDNLTAPPPPSTQPSTLPPSSVSQQQQQTDIYAILSSDDSSVHINDEDIDADALVMNMFDTPFPDIKHPLSSASSNFLNLELARSQPSHLQAHNQPQYTPSSDIRIDPMFSMNYQTEMDPVFPAFSSNSIDFSRRHSVAVSGGLADFNLRNLSHSMDYHQQQQQQQQEPKFSANPCHPQHPFDKQPPPIFARKAHQQLATVVEGESSTVAHPNMTHRASMPNIFLSEESRRNLNTSIQQRVESLSNKTTPADTPPPMPISFNQMPWSTPNNSNSAESRSSTSSPCQQHTVLPASTTMTTTTAAENGSFYGRKRFYSQQFDSFPATAASATMNIPFHAVSTYYQHIRPQPQQLQPYQHVSSNVCPLPMSGIMSRRASVATPNDISTWNRMINSSDRIIVDEQHERKRQKQTSIANNDSFSQGQIPHQQLEAAVIKQEGYSDKSENTSLNGSVATAEENTSNTEDEDYPVITEADLEAAKKDANAIPRRQKLRYQGDQYTPKWVRYTGQLKEGYCDTCKPGKWLQLKNSAFWYHKQFFHGISSVSGKPFQKPVEQRAGEQDVIEGLCHQYCSTRMIFPQYYAREVTTDDVKFAQQVTDILNAAYQTEVFDRDSQGMDSQVVGSLLIVPFPELKEKPKPGEAMITRFAISLSHQSKGFGSLFFRDHEICWL